MTTSAPTPRRTASLTVAGVTVLLPVVLAAFAPAEIVMSLALVLPFGTMMWLERAIPRSAPRRVSMA